MTVTQIAAANSRSVFSILRRWGFVKDVSRLPIGTGGHCSKRPLVHLPGYDRREARACPAPAEIKKNYSRS
jgi:hypothetical protein